MSASTNAILFQLVNDLRHVLQELYNNPYPALQNPPGLKKRASVALIIRIQPQYSHWPPNAVSSNFEQVTDPRKRLETFFDQDWVKYGDPEALFIKRTSRKGDRWAGHIALPGGGRDAEDKDDRAAAIRETLEEVGIDLTEQNAMAVGNLPQRLVTTSWVSWRNTHKLLTHADTVVRAKYRKHSTRPCNYTVSNESQTRSPLPLYFPSHPVRPSPIEITTYRDCVDPLGTSQGIIVTFLEDI